MLILLLSSLGFDWLVKHMLIKEIEASFCKNCLDRLIFTPKKRKSALQTAYNSY